MNFTGAAGTSSVTLNLKSGNRTKAPGCHRQMGSRMTVEYLKRGDAAMRERAAKSGNHDSGQVEAVAVAVSIIAPLFLPIMVFQHQIVFGLSAGAVKG